MTFYGEFHGFVAKPYEIAAFKFDGTPGGVDDMREFIENQAGVGVCQVAYRDMRVSITRHGEYIGSVFKGGWVVDDGVNLNIYLDKVFHQRFRWAG